MGKGNKLAVLAGIVASAGAAALGFAGMPAHADGGVAPSRPITVSANSGACGAWSQPDPWGFHGAYVCINSGIGSGTPIGQRHVDAGTWSCHSDYCVNRTAQGNVPTSAATIDPLLRTATVNANVQGCQINVRFDGTGTLTPNHDLYSFSNGPTVISVAGDAGVSRAARMAGSVCGVYGTANASIFRYVGLGVWTLPGL